MTQLSIIKQPATIRVHRIPKGLLRQRAAKILIDSRLVHFYPKDTEEFHLEPGVLTFTINKRKYLTFPAAAGETKEFIIKEGYTDSMFLIKYGFRLLLVIALFISGIKEGSLDFGYSAFIFGLLVLIWTLNGFFNEYFYVEEI